MINAAIVLSTATVGDRAQQRLSRRRGGEHDAEKLARDEAVMMLERSLVAGGEQRREAAARVAGAMCGDEAAEQLEHKLEAAESV